MVYACPRPLAGYTMEEGAIVLVLWSGRHVNLTDPDSTMWAINRCQNPDCPMGGHDGGHGRGSAVQIDFASVAQARVPTHVA